MNTRKLVVLAAAIAITAANLYGLQKFTDSAANAGSQHLRAAAEVTTLPAIHVTPSAEQRQQLREEGIKMEPKATATGAVMMPFYSFAADHAGA